MKLMKFVAASLSALLVAGLLVGVESVAMPAPAADAAVASEFNPGLIITDSLFFDGNAMTGNQVQAFLQAQIGTCGGSIACINTARANTPNMAAESGLCNAYAGASNERLSDVIAKVGTACGISQKVLLVLLQKEQSLVTDRFPDQWQYDHATGFSCPDTAACDPAYAGFFYQVWYAARQYKKYARNPTGYNHQPGRTNNVLYSPNGSCGSSPVYIQNQATAGLYNYTPYQPNTAALNNLYGEGDGCSSYGNRNFWRLYTDWFGSTLIGAGAAAIASEYAANGGATGTLGAAVGTLNCTSTAAYCSQAYANGALYWSQKFGVWKLSGIIRQTYEALGGFSSALGAPRSQEVTIPDNGGGTGQVFDGGSIYASPAGAFPVLGTMLNAYWAQNGSAGPDGWPIAAAVCGLSDGSCRQDFANMRYYVTPSGVLRKVSPEFRTVVDANSLGAAASGLLTIADNGGGTAQAFSAGSVYSSTAGAFGVSGRIATEYWARGGSSGILGWPVDAASCALPANGCSQSFQGGVIVAQATAKAQVISGPIGTAYQANGGPAGVLGYPTSAVIPIADNGGGSGQVFQNGSIYSSVAGAFAVYSVRSQYWAQGGSAGPLGWPIAAEACVAGSPCTQAFQGGSLSVGAMDAVYAANATLLGAATSGVIVIPENGGGTGRAYAGGSIYSSAAGTFVVSGKVATEYWARGGSAGTLGWPLEAANCALPANGCSQSFQGGVVVSQSTGKAQVVSGAIGTTYQANGGPAGALGYPTSGVITIPDNGGGAGQVFQNGSIYSSTVGAFAVAALRTQYWAQGGSAGALGWPTSAESCVAGTPCTQSFQGGSLTSP